MKEFTKDLALVITLFILGALTGLVVIEILMS